MITRRKERRYLEAEAFHGGIHQIPTEPARGELQARFQREAAQVQHDSVDPLKSLEAAEAILTRRFTDADRHWRRLDEMTDGMAPEIATPILATFLAGLAIVGEIVLLSPILDGLGVAVPVWQVVTAAALVIVTAGLVHLTVRQLTRDFPERAEPDEPSQVSAVSRLHRPTMALLALFTLSLTLVLGWWRASEMIFAASIQQAEWANFLAGHEVLTKLFMTLVTVGLPIFAAIAFDWGFSRLRFAWEWRRAKQKYETIVRNLENTRKRHEALIAKRDARLAMLEKKSDEWQSAYAEKHALGRRIGARRAPLWRAVLRIAAVAALIAVCCLLIDPWLADYLGPRRPLLYACVVLGIGGLYAARALRAWDRPSPIELYRQQAVIWRGPAADLVEAERVPHDVPEVEVEVLPDAQSSPLRGRKAS